MPRHSSDAPYALTISIVRTADHHQPSASPSSARNSRTPRPVYSIVCSSLSHTCAVSAGSGCDSDEKWKMAAMYTSGGSHKLTRRRTDLVGTPLV